MANMIIDFGRTHKGLTIGECDEKYLKWLVSHTKVLAVRNRWASRDAAFELERRAVAVEDAASIARVQAAMAAEESLIETSAPVVVEVAPVERKKIFDRQLCCEVWSDTGERCVPQIFVEGLGWVSPPGSEEVLDVEEGLSWSYAVRRSNSKSRMRAEINATKRSADLGMRGNLNRKAFSILR
jgi:hypothetical protein